MMMSINAWIKAARPKTLPLAIGGSLLGSFYAMAYHSFHILTFVFALFTSILLQILSNFANDYGDFIKGTDSFSQRTDRTLTNGEISANSMKKVLKFLTFIVFLSGIFLLYFSLGISPSFWLMLGIGISAIIAAITYTAGKLSFGYKGFGDVFVFIFFGPVLVVGTYYLHTQLMSGAIWFSAVGFGLLSTAVLNINNTRDLESDQASGKKTLAVILGLNWTRFYHRILVFAGMACMIISLFQIPNILFGTAFHSVEILLMLGFCSPFAVLYVRHIWNYMELNPGDFPGYGNELKTVSVTNFVFSLIHGLMILLINHF